MATPTSDLRMPTRRRGISLGLRIVILTLDFAAVIALAVSLGLYHKWIPSTSYPTTALKPNTHTDWTDIVVLIAVLVSFLWTIFITVRPGWTSEALRLWYCVAFEFLCLAWLLGCTISALILRGSVVKNLIAISNTCDMGSVTLMDGQKVPWVCMPHLETLRKLQVAAYSVACAVAVIHFILFALACWSMIQGPQEPTQTTTPQQIENGPHEKAAQGTLDSTTRGSESDSDPSPPPPRIEVAEI